MKLLTKEQEQAHYNATLKGGAIGGFFGLGIGGLGVVAATRRFQFFRQLTLPLKAFLVTSSGTFAGIIAADHASRTFEQEQNPKDVEFKQRQREREESEVAGKTFTQRAMDFGRRERYKIVGASWLASMAAAFALVNRNKYLTGQQKLVQARVYAQFLTLGVLVATAAFEISDQRSDDQTGLFEKVKVLDPNDPEHKRYIEKERPVSRGDGDEMWKDMVAAEEQRLKERDDEEKRIRGGSHQKKSSSSGKKDQGKEQQGDKKKDDEEDKDDKMKKKEKGEDGYGSEKGSSKQEEGGKGKVPSANDMKETAKLKGQK